MISLVSLSESCHELHPKGTSLFPKYVSKVYLGLFLASLYECTGKAIALLLAPALGLAAALEKCLSFYVKVSI